MLGSFASGGNFTAVTAIGFNSAAAANYATALGADSLASGIASTALGTGSTATGNNSISLGGGGASILSVANSTQSTGNGAIAIGVNDTKGAQALANDAIAIGGQSSVAAGATSGVAVGRGASTLAASGIAMGDGATSGATGFNVAIGADGTAANASGATGGAVAIGRAQRASGNGAVAIGDPNAANGTGAVALGADNVAAGDAGGTTAADGAVAIGNANTAIGQGNIAIGSSSNATTTGAMAVGVNADATSTNAIALGTNANAGQAGAVALGAGSVTAAPVATTGATIAGTAYTFAGTAPASTVSVGAVGAERTITNVAAGRLSGSSTDAINGSQLFATNQAVESVAATASQGWNLSANGEATPQNIAPGGTANFQQGANMEVTRTGNTITIATAKDVAFDSVTTGATVMNNAGVTVGASTLNATGLAITGGPGVTTTGINAGSQAITNVAAGVNATDAVNVSQLTQSNTTAANKWIVGSPATYTAPSSTGTDSTAIGSGAVVNANNAVAVGTGANATVANSIALGNGSTTSAAVATTGTTIQGTTYTFAGGAPTGAASVGSAGNERQIQNVAAGRLSGSSTDAVNGSQLFATNQAVESVAATASQGWNLSANGEATPQNIAPGGTANFQQGANMEVTRTGNTITIATAKDVAFDSVTTGATVMNNAGVTVGASTLNATGLAITGGPGVTTTGINAGSQAITNVAAGVNATDAVNVSQLTQSSTTAANKWIVGSPATYTAPSSTGTDSTAIGSGAAVTASNAVAVGTGANATVANSVALGNNSTTAAAVATTGTTIQGTSYTFAGGAPAGVVSVGSAGAERQIQNVAAGRLSGSSTDAVNGSQLFATNQAVESVAATANQGWNLSANGETAPQNIAPGGTANFQQGANMEVTRTGNTITIATAKDVAFDSVTTGATVMNNLGVAVGASTLSATGLAITGGASVTTTGINAGSQTITNVAAGVNATDAVNVSQLTQSSTTAANKWIVGSPATYTAPSSTGTDSTAIGSGAAVNASNSVAIGTGANATIANSVALGNASTTSAAVAVPGVTLLGTSYFFAGAAPAGVVSVGSAGSERQIQNVAAGRLSSSSTDAINGSQLFATNQAVQAAATTANQGWNLSANGEAAPQNIAPGGTANFQQGANMEVTRTGNTITIATAKDVAFDSVTTGATVMNNLGVAVGASTLGAAGLVVVGGPSLTTAGINAGSRVITNVAPGVNPTDAVNVSQLGQSSGSDKWTIGSPQAYVAPASSGTNSTAVGSGATVTASNAVAVGTGANATTANSVALGNGSTTVAAVASTGTTLQGTNYSFAGANPGGVVSVGSAGNERQVQNVAAGQLSAVSTDAVNGSQLYATNQAVNSLSTTANAGVNVTTSATGSGVAVASSTSKVGPGGVATFTAGNNMVVTQDGAQVAYSVNENPNFKTVTVGTTNIGNNGLTIQGGPSVTTTGVDAGGQVVANVAPGVAGSDAANVNQLNSGLASANAYTDARVAGLQNNINGVARKAYAGVASAMAIESAPYLPGKTTYAAGAGYYQSESAVGLAVRRTSETGRWSVIGGVSASSGGMGARVAFTGVWD